MLNKAKVKTHALLRKSEKYTKTDMVYAARGGFWLVLGYVATALSSFVLALLFARFVPKEIYGNYKYILSLIGLSAVFCLSGLSQGVLQSVARGFYGTFFEAIRLSLRWNSVMFVLLLSGGAYYLVNGNDTLGYSLIWASFTFPIIKTLEIYEPVLSGTRNFRKSTLFRGIVDIGTIVATAIGIFFTDKVLVLIAINLTTQVLLNAIFFRKVYSSILHKNKTIEPGTIKFSKHLSLQNILSGAASYLDKIIIFHFLGAAEVAIYIFAQAIPQQIKGFVSLVSTIAMPKISQRSFIEAARMIPQRFFTGLIVFTPIVLLYILFAPLIFSVFFPAYQEAVPYTRWIILILLIMGNISDLVLTTQKKVKEKYVLNTFASISQIVLMLILIHPFKIYGVIWAYLISKSLTAILSYVLVRRAASYSPTTNN
ncbi:MAG TPA: oligosaccharide flippase family protein [Candidatus Paceibacterota bacterium]